MWQATIVPGLPGEGPWPEQFTHDDMPTHSEGLAVRFDQDDGSHWIGNFQPGISEVSTVRVHPNGSDALVIARGQGYVVAVTERRLLDTFGGYITAILEVPGENVVVFADSDVAFEAISVAGELWRTKRISYDGFRNLRIAGDQILGEAWSPVDDRWFLFTVDIRTGKHVSALAVHGA
jgi:hypothetical protein